MISMARTLFWSFVVISLVLSSVAAQADFEDDSLSGSANPNVCDVSSLDTADGSQQKDNPTCSSTQLGEIPHASKMISTVIIKPNDGDEIQAGTAFDVEIQIKNLDTGFFSDPDSTYYSFSQQLNNEGVIKGHSHVVIQKLKSGTPPNAQKFEFFQGLNGVADGDGGVLGTSVDDGLSAGNYRLCTMISAFSHQGVIMPVAQRGPQDDCIRFRVV